MRKLLLPLAILLPVSAAAQTPGEAGQEDLLGPRSFTITMGLGTSMGWYGGQAERYFREGRLSVFGGLGYAFTVEDGHPTGPAFAAGVRGFTGGPSHRWYLEVAIAQLATSAAHFEGELHSSGRHYGPAVLAGYQYSADGGFTMMAGLGVGYAPGLADGGSPITPALDLGLGYTWR